MLPENARGYRHDLHEPAISVSSSSSDGCLACAAFPLLPTEDAAPFPPCSMAIQPTNVNIHTHVSTHRHQDRVTTITPRTSVSQTHHTQTKYRVLVAGGGLGQRQVG